MKAGDAATRRKPAKWGKAQQEFLALRQEIVELFNRGCRTSEIYSSLCAAGKLVVCGKSQFYEHVKTLVAEPVAGRGGAPVGGGPSRKRQRVPRINSEQAGSASSNPNTSDPRGLKSVSPFDTLTPKNGPKPPFDLDAACTPRQGEGG